MNLSIGIVGLPNVGPAEIASHLAGQVVVSEGNVYRI